MQEKIIEILKEINPFIEVNIDTDLIEEEVLDSLGIMALIEEIEREFQVKIDMGKIEIDDFRSLESIMRLIGRK